MNYIQINIDNILELWHTYGVISSNVFTLNPSWPNNVWAKDLIHGDNIQQLAELLTRNPYLKFASWSECQNHYLAQCSSLSRYQELQFMHLTLNELHKPYEEKSNLSLIKIPSGDRKGLQTFINICKQAFRYEMSLSVLLNTSHSPKAELFLLVDNKDAVATALTYSTKDALGIYQVSVSPNHQRKGYARSLIVKVLKYAKTKHVKTVTLQASEQGLNLYRQLNFKVDGKLSYYKFRS